MYILVNNLKKSAGPSVTRNKQPIKTEEEEKYMKDNQTLQLQVSNGRTDANTWFCQFVCSHRHKSSSLHRSHFDWKTWKHGRAFNSQGILLRLEVREKSGNFTQNTGEIWKNYTGKLKKILESQGNMSASNSENLQIWYHSLN